jgi:hypothetical protein
MFWHLWFYLIQGFGVGCPTSWSTSAKENEATYANGGVEVKSWLAKVKWIQVWTINL